MTDTAFMNRELSWLEFNQRVLDEALDPSVPLLERVKFLAIVSSNLDEFFMVRVAQLWRKLDEGRDEPGPDGLDAKSALKAIAERAHELSEAQHRCFVEELTPLLRAEGIALIDEHEASAEQRAYLDDYVKQHVLPVLTPLAIDPGHPFPHLGNRSLYLIASIRAQAPSPLPATKLAVVHVPSQVVPRFVPLPSHRHAHEFMLLEDVVRLCLPWLYHGYAIESCHAIRVTRDAILDPAAITSKDLLENVEASLRSRRMGAAVRLQYDRDVPAEALQAVVTELELGPDELYAGQGFPAFADLFQLYGALDLPRLKDPSRPPQAVPEFSEHGDMWSVLQQRDVLVHHPYQPFDVVTRFVREAALDPKVLAIKMTLYRVSAISPIAQALTLAAEQGKEVAVLVELQARFDEAANIQWARALEAVGAHVVYGLPGYKTHCKACLVVRLEDSGVRRYCHLATGNYNARTAGLYGDLGLFTCNPQIGEDLTEVFNSITGYMRPRPLHHLLMAPLSLREDFVTRVRREAENARKGLPARMILKMNSLVDPVLIRELYEADRAGVDITLIVRGICCLRPGITGQSENIRVISIIDRYLEHARIYYFDNAGQPEYWLSSADWMPRNLDQRVELAFPVLDPKLQAEVRSILELQISDREKARELGPDGRSRRLRDAPGHGFRSQEALYARAIEARHRDGERSPGLTQAGSSLEHRMA
ncbi:MAG: polyphosphate kinase 1 [Polyangiales bacterium]